MSNKDKILSEFDLFRGNGGGIESWFSDEMPEVVADVLNECDSKPISLEVLNQLLILSHEGGMTPDFFNFYFLSDPHPGGLSWYDPKKIKGFEDRFLRSKEIVSLEHLRWGLTRIYTDALLHFGNIRQSYRTLRSMNTDRLKLFFSEKNFQVSDLTSRANYLPLEEIAKDDRYLIAEVACKTYAPADGTLPDLVSHISDRYAEFVKEGRQRPKIKDLITDGPTAGQYDKDQLSFSLDEAMEQEIT